MMRFSFVKESIVFPIFLFVIAMMSIQSGAALAKTLFPYYGALGLSTLRLVLAAIVLVLIMRPWRAGPIQLRTMRSLIIYGIALCGMNVLFYQALERIPLGIAIMLEFTGPLIVALASSRRWLDLLWIALVVLGLWFMFFYQHAPSQAIDLIGAAYALAAGACWALYIIYGRRAGFRHGQRTVVLGTIVAALIALPIGLHHKGIELFAPTLLPLALAVAILSTALPYSLEMVALKRLPVRTFSTLASLEPGFGALSGLIFLHEQLSLTQWLALFCIITAAVGAAVSANK